jgi:predicted ester cyclase
MSEENKAVVRRVFDEVLGGGDLAVVDDLFTAGYHDHDPANDEDTRGPEGVKEEIGGYRAAMPDMRFTIGDQVAEGDRVATRFSFEGTHQGELLGVAPTGDPVSLSGIVIHRLVDGRIAEGHWNWDTLGLLRQIGAIPVEQVV